MRSLIILASALMLGACQSNFYHHEPESDAATLIFSSNNQAVQPMVCVPGQGFKDTRYAVGRGGSQLADELAEALNKRIEVEATVTPSAHTLVAFRFRQSKRSGIADRCRIAAAFPTQAGETYQVRFIREFSTCRISVISRDDEKELSIEYVSRSTSQQPECRS